MDLGLGAHFRSVRKQRGLTLDDVAALTGLTAGALSLIESGKRVPRPENAAQIARALGLDPDETLGSLEDEHARQRRSRIESTLRDIASGQAKGDSTAKKSTRDSLPTGRAAAQARAARPPVVARSSAELLRSSARSADRGIEHLRALDGLADEASIAIRALKGALADPDEEVRYRARRLLTELDVRLPDEG